MNQMLKRMVVMASLVSASIVWFHAGTAAAEIKFAILPRLSAMEMFAMFEPLANYLTKETGEKVSLVLTKDFDAFKTAVEAGQVDIAFANPVIYLQLKKNAGLDVLAVAAEKKAGTKFRGLFIARKDSAIDTVQDLKGKKLIFVDKDSAAGYIFQLLLLSKAGLDVHKDFTVLPFAKKQDNVIMAVFNKTADAGAIREDDLDKMKDKLDVSQIKIVAYTEYFPNWPVFRTSKLNKDAAAKIRAALLKLKPNDAESEKILGAAKLAGFASITDKDYDLLRLAARLAGAL